MKSTFIIKKRGLTAHQPILIEGLPGIGLVGKIATAYLRKELKAEKVAELYSPHFPHHVIMKPNGMIRLVKNDFYLWRNPKEGGNDLLFLEGDAQPVTPEGQYEVNGIIIDFLKSLGGTEVITLGGYGVGYIVERPRVFGSATHKDVVEKYKAYDIDFGGARGSIIGAAGLLLGIGKLKGVKGFCLMGETHGAYIDPRSAAAVLSRLTKILGIEIDLSKLEKSAQENEQTLKKLENETATMQQAFGEYMTKSDKDLTYIR